MALAVPQAAADGVAMRVGPATPWNRAGALKGLGHVAFHWDDGLWSVVDGHLYGLGAGTYPRWSPNGRYLAYLKGGSLRLGLGRQAGQRLNLGGAIIGPQDYAWLPGSKELVVAGQDRGLWLVTAGTDQIRRLSQSAEIGSLVAGPGTIAYTLTLPYRSPIGRSDALYVMRLGHAARRLVVAKGEGLQLAALVGSKVLYWRDPEHSASIASDGMALDEIGSTGGRPQALARTLGYRRWLQPMDGSAVDLVAGGPRLAWAHKHLEACTLVRGSCALLAGTRHEVALDPALGPTGQLIYVRAINLGQQTWGFSSPRGLAAWIASRHLVLRGRSYKESSGAFAPQWTANARTVLYIKNGGIWLLHTRTGSTGEVVGGFVGDPAQLAFYGHLSFASTFAFAP